MSGISGGISGGTSGGTGQQLSINSKIPNHFAYKTRPSIVSSSTSAGRRTLKVFAGTNGVLGTSTFNIPDDTSIDLDAAANWDSAYTSYATAENRAGKDFYLYATANGLILSPNATVPTGHTASNSRKIGGFQCVPANIVGVAASHGAYGFLAGDIAYPSIWDLMFRPACSPEGMAYDPKITQWVDIWLQSGTGSNTQSVMGATITDTREQYNHAKDFAAVGKRMLDVAEFEITAAGSPETANIAGSADPGVTGATLATNGASQVSDRFCWQMTGVMYQWCRDTGYRNDDVGYVGTYTWKSTGGAGLQYTQGGSGEVGLHAGGSWNAGSICGSRCRVASSARTSANANCGSRGCCSTKVIGA